MTSADGLAARIAGMLHSPRPTLARVATAPRWGGVLAVTFTVSALVSAAVLETDAGQLALLDQWERTAIAFGQPPDAARYSALVDASEYGGAYAVLTAILGGPVLAFALAAGITVAFRGSAAEVRYAQVLAVVAHAGVILMVRQLVLAPFIYLGETMASPLTLARFAPGLDEGSPLTRLLGTVDLLVLWWIVVLAIGVSVLYKRPARPIAVGLAAVYALLAAALAALTALA